MAGQGADLCAPATKLIVKEKLATLLADTFQKMAVHILVLERGLIQGEEVQTTDLDTEWASYEEDWPDVEEWAMEHDVWDDVMTADALHLQGSIAAQHLDDP